MYSDDEMLMLSGIQHYRFCPRQWALIHMEQQWEENHLTVEGHFMHKNVDSPFYRQKCGDLITLRAVNIASHSLGLYGISDIIELHPSNSKNNTIKHPQYPGFWIPYPIEYKRGKSKANQIDEVQLVAQAICLEEQYGIEIEKGAIFYGETRRRNEVCITPDLRDIVSECTKSMHEIFKTGNIPPINKGKHCRKCSLMNICMPNSVDCTKASYYLKKHLYEETT